VERALKYPQPAATACYTAHISGERSFFLGEAGRAGVYVPMGERRSIVSTRSKRDACLLLDEFAAVEPEDLHEVENFMLGFALSDDGGVVLSDLGEATRELFEEKIYPVLYQAKQKAERGVEEPVKNGGPEIRAAVEKERTRLQGKMRRAFPPG